MTDNEVYEKIPAGIEFNARDINVLLGDKWESFSKSYSIDTEAIMERLHRAGKVLRGSGDHCYWYIKNKV